MNGNCAPTSCQSNQVLVNGECLCDNLSVKLGKGCVKC